MSAALATHTRDRPPNPSPICVECSDLPWRRPRNRRRLCACGETYAEEPSDYVAPERERVESKRTVRLARYPRG